jgi:hypothetical protein
LLGLFLFINEILELYRQHRGLIPLTLRLARETLILDRL